MGLFDSLKSTNSTSNNENMRPSPVEEFLVQHYMLWIVEELTYMFTKV